MANYSLVVDSKFTPFTLEESLKPALLATEMHYDLEDKYNTLADTASGIEGLINPALDTELYERSKSYSEDLNKEIDSLASQGITPSTRRSLMSIKNRYNKEIAPIETAYKTKQKLIEEQRKALQEDNTLMFDVDYRNASLRSLIDNPTASFTPLSGADIAKKTAIMAKEAANAVLTDPEYDNVFHDQYVQQKLTQGYDINQIIAAAQRDPNAPKELLGIVDTIKNQVNYDNWSKDNQDKIDSYINEGLNAAIGTTKIDIMTDRNFASDIEKERMDLMKSQYEYETKGIKQADGSYYKPLGGGRILHTKPDGTYTVIGATTKEDKAKQKLEQNLSEVSKVSDMRKTGFTPVGIVARIGGSWIGGKEGEDIGNDTLFGFTRTNLKTTWGDFSYTPEDSNAEATIVTNLNTIPGFEQWIEGKGKVLEEGESTAFGKIVEQAINAGITNEEFWTNNIRILKVKAKGSRASSESPYDYIIYRKS